MGYLVVNKNGDELIFSSYPTRFYDEWHDYVVDDLDTSVVLPKGTIKKLINRELTWDDEYALFGDGYDKPLFKVKHKKLDRLSYIIIGEHCYIIKDFRYEDPYRYVYSVYVDFNIKTKEIYELNGNVKINVHFEGEDEPYRLPTKEEEKEINEILNKINSEL